MLLEGLLEMLDGPDLTPWMTERSSSRLALPNLVQIVPNAGT